MSSRDLLPGYAEYLKKLVDISAIRPLKVVVDAGNGMAGDTVPTVFEGLPITTVPLYFELDGSFPNHEANPIDPKNLRDLQKAVREHQADIGLAFDGDADRCFVVDERGEVVSPSVLTALIAAREVLLGSPAPPSSTTSSPRGRSPRSSASTAAPRSGPGSATRSSRRRWRRPRPSSAASTRATSTSGTSRFADSGMLAALHTLAALGHDDRPLSAILAEFSRFAASGEINSEVIDQAGTTQRVKDGTRRSLA